MAKSRKENGHYLLGHSEPGPGRDSLYNPSMNDAARKLALLGLTDKEIGEFFGIGESTMTNWKREHPAFLASLNEGKVIADADVADSLYRRAIGEVVFTERQFRTKEGDYEIVRLSQKVPADPGAAKLWLTNRQPQIWRDKHEVEHIHRSADMSDDELTRIAGRSGNGAAAPEGDKTVVH